MTVHVIDQALQQRASDILIDPKDQIRLRGPAVHRRHAANFAGNADRHGQRRHQQHQGRLQHGHLGAAATAGRRLHREAGRQHHFLPRGQRRGAERREAFDPRLNQNAGRFTLTDMGLPERQQTLIVDAISKPSGMVLVCGPTGSGKTTTLYSMLNHIDRMTHNVITVEDPIEAHLPDASQIEINAKADITFAKALRSILRQDPDVICVGEIRDEETAEIALRAAQTGHLVLATIHCDSNATALIRLLDLGVSPDAAVLRAEPVGVPTACAQALRRLQEAGSTRRQPCSRSSSKEASIRRRSSSRGGCQRCGGTGYYGRMAICDLLTITDALRTEIANNGGHRRQTQERRRKERPVQPHNRSTAKSRRGTHQP